MATLTLIGEPFADLDAAAHTEAARELTEAVAISAPRGCSSRLLIATERDVPSFDTARARVELLPMRTAALPVLWRTGLTARPLDGEFVHALTPLVPLRSRAEDDGTQTSVMVPHALGWLAPDLMGASSARQYRSFVKRAVRHADVVVTPTHATAEAIQERFGDVEVQVLPLAAPRGYLRPDDDAERRAELRLPDRYLATTAVAGDIGRLEWVFEALEEDAGLPPLVVIADYASPSVDESKQRASGADGAEPVDPVPEALRGRVLIVHPRENADIGTILSGAELLVLPQQLTGAGYEVIASLTSGVPVVHAGCAAVAEIVLDAGIRVEDSQNVAAELSRITRDDEELSRLRILADDRSHSFSWALTAAMLWELHANI